MFTKKLITNELLVKNISKQAVQCVIKKLRQLEKKRPPPKKKSAINLNFVWYFETLKFLFLLLILPGYYQETLTKLSATPQFLLKINKSFHFMVHQKNRQKKERHCTWCRTLHKLYYLAFLQKKLDKRLSRDQGEKHVSVKLHGSLLSYNTLNTLPLVNWTDLNDYENLLPKKKPSLKEDCYTYFVCLRGKESHRVHILDKDENNKSVLKHFIYFPIQPLWTLNHAKCHSVIVDQWILNYQAH